MSFDLAALQPMIDKFLEFAPNLIGALAILVIGWLVALAISAAVRGALRRTGLGDRIARSIAGDGAAQAPDLTQGIAKGVYYIIMLGVLIAFFQQLKLTIITEPLTNLLNQVLGYLPQLAGAGALLLIAWILATVLRAILSRVLDAANIDRRFGGTDEKEDEEAESSVPLSKTLSDAVYWLVFLFFLPMILEALKFQGLLQPVQGMINKLLGFLPNLLGAAVILAIGWLVATIVRRIVTGVLAGIGADRLGERIGLDLKLSGLLGTVVYIFIFLPVVISALNTLALDAVTQPASNMLNMILGFLPNLFAAVIILGIGWFLARIIQRFMASLLASIGVDRLSERVGLNLQLSTVLATVVYALILIPVLIAALNALALDAVTQQASNMLNMILGALPAIFTAIAVVAVSFILGRVVAGVVANILTGVGFNSVLVWLGVGQEPEEGKKTASEIVGYLVLVAIMLFATIEAFSLLGFVSLVGLVNVFTVIAGRIILGLIIFAVGLWLANLAAKAVRASGSAQAGLLALAARVCVLVLSGAMALLQMGLANEIINLAFGLLLGAIAVAIAIAFGIGGRDIAARQLEKWTESIESDES